MTIVCCIWYFVCRKGLHQISFGLTLITISLKVLIHSESRLSLNLVGKSNFVFDYFCLKVTCTVDHRGAQNIRGEFQNVFYLDAPPSRTFTLTSLYPIVDRK